MRYNSAITKQNNIPNGERKESIMKKLIACLLLAATLICCVAFTSCEEAKDVAKVIDINLSEEQYAFAVNKNDTDLLAKVNAFLKKIKENGKFDEICNNYYGNGTPLTFQSAAEDASKDQLIVATSTGFEPFEMVDQNGNFSGIDMEIAYYLAQELGKELVIKDIDFDAIVNSVNTGICDIGMAGMTVTPAREKEVTFSESYYNASQVVVVKADDTTFDNCKTKEDVEAILNALTADKKAGCQAGTTGETYIVGDKFNADGTVNEDGYGFPGLKAQKCAYKYVALAITDMINGNVDLVIVDNGPAKAVVNKMNGK